MKSHPSAPRQADKPERLSVGTHLCRSTGAWTGFGICIGALGAGLAFREMGFSALDAVIALCTTALFVLPVGATAVTFTYGNVSWSLDRLALSAVVGFPLASAVYYILASAGLSWLFVPLSACLALLLVWRRSRGSCSPSTLGLSISAPAPSGVDKAALIGILGCALYVASRGNQALVHVAGGLAYDHSPDSLVYLSILKELAREIPYSTVTPAVGIPFRPYHTFGYMLGAFVVRSGGLDPDIAYHGVLPLTYAVLAALGLYSLAVLIRPRRRLAIAVVVYFFFVLGVLELCRMDSVLGHQLTKVFPEPVLQHMFASPATGGGHVTWLSIVALLHLASTAGASQGWQRALILAGVIAGISFFVKVTLFVALFPAFGLVCLIRFVKVREPALLIAPGVACLIVLAIVLSWPSTTDVGFSVADTDGPEQPGFGAQVRAWGMIARGLHYSIIVAFWVAIKMRWDNRSTGIEKFFLIALGTLLLLGSAYSSVSLPFGPVEWLVRQVFQDALHVLPLATALIDLLVLEHLLSRHTARSSSWVLGVILMLAACLSPLLTERQYNRNSNLDYYRRPETSRLVLSPDEWSALKYLRTHTPEDAIVLYLRPTELLPPPTTLSSADLRPNAYALISGLAGRGTVLEYYQGTIDPARDRLGDLEKVFDTTEPDVAASIASKYGADFLLEYAQRPLRFRGSMFEAVFRSGELTIWKVPTQ